MLCGSGALADNLQKATTVHGLSQTLNAATNAASNQGSSTSPSAPIVASIDTARDVSGGATDTAYLSAMLVQFD